jgi:copper(I)-binding protein
MKRLFVVLCGAVALLALPALASAQTHADKVHKADLHFSDPTVVGTVTLEAGDYRFECKTIDGKHVMVLKNAENGKEVASVPCKPVDLTAKVDATQFRTIKREDGKRALSDIRVKGELIAHTVVAE